MRNLLLSQRRVFIQAASAKKAVNRMGSFHTPTSKLRTLAQCPQLPISEAEDDPEIRFKYRPFLLGPAVESTDWISQLELGTAISMAESDLAKTKSRLKVLVLYGSLRKRYVHFEHVQKCSDLLHLARSDHTLNSWPSKLLVSSTDWAAMSAYLILKTFPYETLSTPLTLPYKSFAPSPCGLMAISGALRSSTAT